MNGKPPAGAHSQLKIISFLPGVLVFFLLHLPHGLAWASIIQEKTQKVETINKKDGTAHSQADVTILKIPGLTGRYDFKMQGHGEYAGYKNVIWASEADIEERGGVAFVLRSSTEVYSNGEAVFQAAKDYDYGTNTATVELRKEKDRASLIRQFPIQGPICDDVTMVYLFNKIIPAADGTQPQSFYLLTNEPRLYNVMIKRKGEETISLPSGQWQAEKFQLMADLGLLTELAAKIVPPTFVWFPKHDPRDWVRYEGMETGFETANIIAYVVDGHMGDQNREPSD